MPCLKYTLENVTQWGNSQHRESCYAEDIYWGGIIFRHSDVSQKYKDNKSLT